MVRPATAATAPPMSIHMALSVGLPVKKRFTSEPNEFEAWTPRTIRMIPPTSRANGRALFIYVCLCCVNRSQRFLALDDADEDHDDGDDEQDVDESTDGVAGDHAEQPGDDEDQCECV